MFRSPNQAVRRRAEVHDRNPYAVSRATLQANRQKSTIGTTRKLGEEAVPVSIEATTSF